MSWSLDALWPAQPGDEILATYFNDLRKLCFCLEPSIYAFKGQAFSPPAFEPDIAHYNESDGSDVYYFNYAAGAYVSFAGEVWVASQDIPSGGVLDPADLPTAADPSWESGVWVLAASPKVYEHWSPNSGRYVGYHTLDRATQTSYRGVKSAWKFLPIDVRPNRRVQYPIDWSGLESLEDNYNYGIYGCQINADEYFEHNGHYYQCTTTHLKSADKEPGVGADWTSYWTQNDSDFSKPRPCNTRYQYIEFDDNPESSRSDDFVSGPIGTFQGTSTDYLGRVMGFSHGRCRTVGYNYMGSRPLPSDAGIVDSTYKMEASYQAFIEYVCSRFNELEWLDTTFTVDGQDNHLHGFYPVSRPHLHYVPTYWMFSGVPSVTDPWDTNGEPFEWAIKNSIGDGNCHWYLETSNLPRSDYDRDPELEGTGSIPYENPIQGMWRRTWRYSTHPYENHPLKSNYLRPATASRPNPSDCGVSGCDACAAGQYWSCATAVANLVSDLYGGSYSLTQDELDELAYNHNEELKAQCIIDMKDVLEALETWGAGSIDVVELGRGGTPYFASETNPDTGLYYFDNGKTFWECTDPLSGFPGAVSDAVGQLNGGSDPGWPYTKVYTYDDDGYVTDVEWYNSDGDYTFGSPGDPPGWKASRVPIRTTCDYYSEKDEDLYCKYIDWANPGETWDGNHYHQNVISERDVHFLSNKRIARFAGGTAKLKATIEVTGAHQGRVGRISTAYVAEVAEWYGVAQIDIGDGGYATGCRSNFPIDQVDWNNVDDSVNTRAQPGVDYDSSAGESAPEYYDRFAYEKALPGEGETVELRIRVGGSNLPTPSVIQDDSPFIGGLELFADNAVIVKTDDVGFEINPYSLTI